MRVLTAIPDFSSSGIASTFRLRPLTHFCMSPGSIHSAAQPSQGSIPDRDTALALPQSGLLLI
jgi:hypothetical protein